ncbi:MAG: OsmC family protein [Magnetococcales bacterium]|nr:OsmC family protein [Magnetococcales bacterium]
MSAGIPEISVSFPGGKKVDASVDGFTIHTDQPVKVGGNDSAPAPFLLFLSSLATCAGIYVLAFCQNRNLPTEGITLNQSHEYGPGAAPGTVRLSKVAIDVQVPADFPEKYHEALVRVANKCAVKQVVMDPPEFEIRTVVASE